jgi:glutamine amidotransferase
MIGILNVGLGNLRSVENAVYENGFDPLIVEDASALDELTHLIIPGVGNFGAAMPEIDRRGLRAPIIDFAESGRPLLGACLGMQLLMAIGEESGIHEGFGFVDGRVVRMTPPRGFRVPHVGWNTVNIRRAHPIFEGIKNGRDFYFVHSYAAHCVDETDVLGVTDHGGAVTAVIGRGNVIGFQFHPEKSQLNGLKLIENFCRWDGKC